MKAGEVLRTFRTQDDLSVVLRMPVWEDTDDLMELINSIVEEGAEIGRSEKVSREDEIDWLSDLLARIEKGKAFMMVADIAGQIVASADINQLRGYEKHVGTVGIVVEKGFRDRGIGTEIMRTVIDQARKMQLRLLTLCAFASNSRALHVYEKVGFVQTGMIPKKYFKDGVYTDEVIMARVLE
jgi:RimJ/RimL family protein N-acetyltransferase